MTDALDRGREAFGQQEWAEAYTRLSAADQGASLEPEDLERLAVAAYLVGRDTDSTDALVRAHQAFLRQGEVKCAVRCAFWLSFRFLNRGEQARGAGWVARARRLLDDVRHDCVERGYLLLQDAFQCLGEGDTRRSYAAFCGAFEVGERFEDPDLMAMAQQSRGRVLIRMGEIGEGVTLLDEAMAAVEAGEVSPVVVGDVYCSVISGCMEIFDMRRAQEWTEALTRWCASQPGLVAYRGECLVRRAQIMHLRGAWQDAMDEAQRACERLSPPPDQPTLGAAFYQQAELHRLQGAFTGAEEAYRQASQRGRKLQPGLALLRLAQGQVDAAEAAIRRAVEEDQNRRTRSRLLPAYVEIVLATGDVQAARAAADELAEIAAALDAPFLHAVAAHATGAVLLAEGDARAALASLRRAGTSLQELEAPYEAARVRVLIGLACRALGDEDTAAMELDTARLIFRRLEATPDLHRVDRLIRHARRGDNHGLTPRQLQVLRLVASGEANKAIAAELFISERTVERHVSDIFGKLGVSSRAAATAYAYEHQLV